MNFKRKLQILLLSFIFILPLNVLAYSKEVILGGENIGIKVNCKYITVVGFYEVNGKYIAKDSGLEIGDKILEIDNKPVENIDDMVAKIQDNTINITILSNDKKKNIILNIPRSDDGKLSTGMYVKDKITGIGTLTFIDPNTKIFGALGHEITDSTIGQKVEIKDGEIFKSTITGITKGNNGTPGEKNASFDTTDVYGDITKNDDSGIFGKYTTDINSKETIKIGTKDEIKLGEAKMLTVIENNQIEEFVINITNIEKNNKVKNILFEVKDKKLIDRTNGIVGGMSGSPIIQNNKLVAAVTHVVVSNPTKGYGILIEKMLEESDKSR